MIYSERLNKISNIRHGISTRNTPEIEKLRKQVITVKQVHKDTILWIEERPKIIYEADAIGTTLKALPIAVLTADCVPIFIVACDENKRAKSIMCIHAGWRGTALEIAAKSLRRLVEESKQKNFIAVIGPCISQKSFEVGEEVVQAFPNAIERNIATFLKIEDSKKKYLFDLPGENSHQLQTTAKSLGINLEIENMDICTLQRADLHSFRRDKENAGRILSFIELI